jgi:phenylalanyl-tRNA synthetase beta chain
MICAEDEIGIGTSHAGIIVLPPDASVGIRAKDYYDIKDDYILEVDITPNRADACSHYGVARDLYAYLLQHGYETELTRPTVSFDADNRELDIAVRVENTAACPRYSGVSVMGVTVKESPEWLQDKLRLIGVRPINNVVDISNYILHAFGQPLHCFDADKIHGKQVVVKTLPAGTPFVTLDGAERKLSEHDLMICGADDTPMCIGGVFGGLESGCTEATKNVFIESAYFHPTWIRKTARRHGLNTDASFRYERGIDPNNTLYCLQLAASMVKELGGGVISSDMKDVYPAPIRDFEVELAYEKVNSLIGQEIAPETVKNIVRSLEMRISSETPESLKLEVPPYRVDVQRDVDVIEDVLRIFGYNNIAMPESLKLNLNTRSETDKSNKQQNIVAEQLVGAGFQEILNNSLTRAAYYEHLEAYPVDQAVRLLNPLSADLNVMRQTLLFGGLESIAHNANRQNADLKFFEFGNCYRFDVDRKNPEKPLSAYREDYRLGLWLTGKRVSGAWAHPEEETSVYQLKGYVENILSRLGLERRSLVMGKLTNDVFSSALTLSTRGGKQLVVFGIVHGKLLKALDVDSDVFFAELNWTELMRAVRTVKVSFKELPKFPAVKRDLALLLDKDVEFSAVERVAYETERKLLKDVWLFDVYEGKHLEAGKKSYAVSFLLQDEGQTLTDKVIEKTMNRLQQQMETGLGAKLR